MHENSFNQNAEKYFVFMLINYHFSPSIMSTKPYLCQEYEKNMKSISGLIKYLNFLNDYFYLKSLHKSQQKYQNKKDVLSKNWENKSDLLDTTNTTIIANIISEISIENIPWKNLFASEFLLALREK